MAHKNSDLFYFNKFPKIDYQFNSTQVFATRNILKRSKFIDKIKENYVLLLDHVVKDGETPESIAKDYYGSPHLFWIVMMMNDIKDYYHDWIMTDDKLSAYITKKYGTGNEYDTHHYETTTATIINGEYPGEGYIVDSSVNGAIAVTNTTYEVELNATKRHIKILKPEYVSGVVREFKEIMKD